MSFFGTIGRVAGGFLAGGPAGALAAGASSFLGTSIGHGFAGMQGRGAPVSAAVQRFGPCPPTHFRRKDGQCQAKPRGPGGFSVGGVSVSPTAFLPGGDPLFSAADQFGAAVNGRYGAALEPGMRATTTRLCPRGTVLGNDGLCYNKISNKDRMYPKGANPLLTGGEMRAIRIASTAAGRLERTTKRLQKLGLVKKPAPRRRQISGSHLHG